MKLVQEKAPADMAGAPNGEGGEAGEAGEEEDEEYEIPEVREGPLEPRAWTDLGTAKEMESNQVQPSRPPVSIDFFRRLHFRS